MAISHTGQLLLVDDDPDLLRLLALRLQANGYSVTTAASGREALAKMTAVRPDLVLTDLRMDGMDGMALFAEIQKRHTGLPVIVLTAHGTIPDAVAAVRQGVFGYLTKPYEAGDVLAQIERALQLHGTAARPSADIPYWRRAIVTKSPLMEELLLRAQRVAQSQASVLIQGESGTGKELLARAIHLASMRRDESFIAVNCGAIPDGLLESELFGHRKGAFTGAIADHPGLFLQANGGTLLLDEIGDLPLPLQVKLLRVLETREVRPLGGTDTIPVDVRILSASHRDLAAARIAGDFREDLFYRLNVVTLRMPSLAERRDDVPLLAVHFLKRLGARYRKPVNAFSPEALAMLTGADWPGNVRQLQNVVEQAVVLATTDIVPVGIIEQAMQRGHDSIDGFEEARRVFEHGYLTRLMTLTAGNVAQAARIAKRNRTEFYKLLQRHGLEANRFKSGDASNDGAAHDANGQPPVG